MSTTTTAPLNEYLFILPDYPQNLQKRLSVRTQHMQGIKPDAQIGKITLGGAMLHEHPRPGDEGPPSMKGSVLCISAATQEEAMERIKDDVYAREGVWDLSKVQCIPFKTATRIPLSSH